MGVTNHLLSEEILQESILQQVLIAEQLFGMCFIFLLGS